MDDCPVPSPMDQYGKLRRERREGMYTPVRDMLLPDVRAKYDDALASAAAATMSRDALWRNPPPLAEGCEHDFELLPIVEFRQTVICANCGGLDAERSLKLQREPLKIMTVPGRGIYMDGARIASRIRPDGLDRPGPLGSAP